MARGNFLTPERRAKDFWSRVDVKGPDECWPWKGYIRPNGYGRVSWFRRMKLTHRVAFELANGSIDEDLEVCHSCDFNPCCNPKHLFQGTHSVNMQDMLAKGRRRSPRGEAHSQSKLTEADVRLVRSRVEVSNREFARRLGVDKALIARIRKGDLWKHVV